MMDELEMLSEEHYRVLAQLEAAELVIESMSSGRVEHILMAKLAEAEARTDGWRRLAQAREVMLRENQADVEAIAAELKHVTYPAGVERLVRRTDYEQMQKRAEEAEARTAELERLADTLRFEREQWQTDARTSQAHVAMLAEALERVNGYIDPCWCWCREDKDHDDDCKFARAALSAAPAESLAWLRALEAEHRELTAIENGKHTTLNGKLREAWAAVEAARAGKESK